MFLVHLTRVLHLRQARDQAFRGRDIAQHPYQQVLHELEATNRTAKLFALAGVTKRVLIRTLRAAHGLPRNAGAGHSQDPRRVLERAGIGEAVLLANATVLEPDPGVLHGSERDLAFHLLGFESWRALLDKKALYLATLDVAGPDDDHIGEGGVADPRLLAIKDPAIAVSARTRRQAACGT
jgi:hypothetical protein